MSVKEDIRYSSPSSFRLLLRTALALSRWDDSNPHPTHELEQSQHQGIECPEQTNPSLNQIMI